MTNTVTTRYIPGDPKPFRALDAVVIIICLLLVFWFLRLFYLNLYQTLDSNLDSIGFVTMRINNIQRRQGDRVLWDRIRNESPVYSGDLIRVAEESGVAFHCDGNIVELEENTMIRIYKSADGHTRIELAQGTLNLDTGEDGGGISLIVGGKTIEAQAGTVLRQVSANDENTLTVAQGFAVLIDETGDPFEAQAGVVISFTGNNIETDATNSVFAEEAVIEPIPEIEIVEQIEEVLETPPSPPPLLPAPLNLLPAGGYTFGPAEVRSIRSIAFNWSPVDGANAYLLAIYRETANGRQLISRTNPLISTSWTVSDLRILNRGSFTWQVEAIHRDANGVIQRRGIPAERNFIVDIPVPEVELHETRNLYDQ